MRDTLSALEIPAPADIHREIGHLVRRTRALRQLLRLSTELHQDERKNQDHKPPREGEVPRE